MGEVKCGVIMTSKQRSGWPKWNRSGKGAQSRKAKRRQQRKPIDRFQALTLNTLTSDAIMNAPAPTR